jgi:hypothetical protein
MEDDFKPRGTFTDTIENVQTFIRLYLPPSYFRAAEAYLISPLAKLAFITVDRTRD